jgi:hypothetical protein
VSATQDASPSAVEVTPVLTYGERLRVTSLLTLGSPAAMFWVLLPSACGLFLLMTTLRLGHDFQFADTMIITLAFVIIPMLELFKVRRQQRAARAHGPHHYRFDHEGLSITAPNSGLTLRWAAIPRVRERAGFLMVYFHRSAAHCMPLHMLTREEADAIVRFARDAGVARIEVPRN